MKITIPPPEAKKSEKIEDPKLENIKLTFVNKWVDYSSKYGLGYLLSSGIVGIQFNDNTKMISIKDAPETVEYITKEMESREEKYIEAIEILKQRLYGTKGNRRRPN